MAISRARRILRVFLVLVLVGLVGLGIMAWQRGTPESLWSRAQAAREAGQREAAVLLLRNLVQKAPEHAEAHRLLATLHLEAAREEHPQVTYSHVPAALEHLARAAELQPEDVELQQTLLIALTGAERPREAREVAARILKIEPKHSDALYTLAHHAVESKSPEEAQSAVAELTAAEPTPRLRTLILQYRLAKKSDDDEQARTIMEACLARLLEPGQKLNAWEVAATDELLPQAIIDAADTAEAERRMDVALKLQEARVARGQAERGAAQALRLASALASRPAVGLDLERRKAIWERVLKVGQAARKENKLSIQSLRELAIVAFAAQQDNLGMDLLQQGIEKLNKEKGAQAKAVLDFHLLAARQLITQQKFRSARMHVEPLLNDPLSAGWGNLLAGHVALSEGRLEEALRHLEQSRRQLGSTLMVRLALARTLMALKRWSDAIPYLASLHVDPQALEGDERAWAEQHLSNGDTISLLEVQARLSLGDDQRAAMHLATIKNPAMRAQGETMRVMAAWNRKDHKQALALLEEAKKRSPGSPVLGRLEAILLIQSGQQEAGGKLIESLAQKHPDDAAIQVLLYRWQLARGETEAAELLLAGLIERFPNDPSILLLGTQRELASGKLDKALELAERLQSTPGGTDAGIVLEAAAALKQNDVNTASEVLEVAKQSERRVGAVDLLQADVELARGNVDAAVDSLAGSMEFTGTRAAASRSLVRTLMQLADQQSVAEADKRLEALLQVYPDEPQLLIARADLQSRQGNLLSAFETLQKLERLTPQSALAAFCRAQIWWKQQKPREALEDLKTVLKREPKHQVARRLAIVACLQLKQPSAAAEHVAEGLKHDPENIEFRLLNAQVLRASDRKDEALTATRTLVEEHPEVAQTHLLLAELLLEEGQADEAVTVLAAGREKAERPEALVLPGIALLSGKRQSEAANRLAEEFAGSEPDFRTAESLARTFLAASRHEEAARWSALAEKAADDTQRLATHLLSGEVALAAGSQPMAEGKAANSEALKQARTHYAAALEIEPTHPVAGNNLAWLLLTHFNEPTAARELAERIYAAHPPHRLPAAFFDTYLTICRKTGQLDRARDVARVISRLQPGELRWMLTRAELVSDQQGIEEILEDLNHAQTMQPWSPAPAYAKARVWSSMKHPRRALDEVASALKTDSKHLPSRLLGIELCRELSDWSQMLAHAEFVLQQHPEEWEVYSHQIEALKKLGQTAQAEAALNAATTKLQAAIAAQPEKAELRLALSALYRRQAQPEKAVELLEQSHGSSPQEQALSYELVRSLLEAKRTDEAYTLAKERFGETADASLCLTLGRLFYTERAFEAAADWGRTALERASEDQQLSAHWLLGDVTLAMGEKSGSQAEFLAAREHYQFVLKQQPQHLVAGNNLAWLLAHHLQLPQEAVAVVDRVRGGAPVQQLHPSFVDTLVSVYRANGKLDEAKSILKIALEQHPAQAEFHFELGMVCLQQEQPAAARHSLSRALELGLGQPRADEARRALETLGGEE